MIQSIIGDFNETMKTLNNAMRSIVQANTTIRSIDSILNEVNINLLDCMHVCMYYYCLEIHYIKNENFQFVMSL